MVDRRYLFFLGIADTYASQGAFLRGKCKDAQNEQLVQFRDFVQHPAGGYMNAKLELGCYTMATEIATATATALVNHTPECSSERMVEAWIAERGLSGARRPGYVKSLLSLMERVASGGELGEPKNDPTDNSILPRALPFGIMGDLRNAIKCALRQTAITHTSDEAKMAVRALVATMHYSARCSPRYDAGYAGLNAFIKKQVPELWENHKWRQCFTESWGNSEIGEHEKEGIPLFRACVWATLHGLRARRTYMQMIEYALSCGGDTGMVAGLLWSIACHRGAEHDYKGDDVPSFMYERMEKVGRGLTDRTHLIGVGELHLNRV